MDFFRTHKLAVVIFVIALGVRLGMFAIDFHADHYDIGAMVGSIPATQAELVAHDAGIGGDCYFETSENVIAGRGFSCQFLAPYEPYQYGVPLYPLFLIFLLALTHSYLATVLVQLAFSAVLPVVALYLVGMLVPTWPRAKLWTGLILALAPTQVIVAFSFSPEVLFMIIFSVFFILWMRYLGAPSLRWAVWSGLALGLATLTKPTAQYIPLVCVLFVLWRYRHTMTRKLAGELGAFALVFLLTISPWAYRNYSSFGAVALSTQTSRALYVALLPSVIAIEQGTSFNAAQAPLLAQHPNNFTFANSAHMDAYSISQLVRYPLADMKMALLSGFTFFTHDGVLTALQTAGVVPDAYLGTPAIGLLLHAPVSFMKAILHYVTGPFSLVLIGRLFFLIVFILFLVGLWYLYRDRRESPSPAIGFAVIMVLYFMVTTMSNGLAVTSRFRMPVEWIILAVAYLGYRYIMKHHERILAPIARIAPFLRKHGE